MLSGCSPPGLAGGAGRAGRGGQAGAASQRRQREAAGPPTSAHPPVLGQGKRGKGSVARAHDSGKAGEEGGWTKTGDRPFGDACLPDAGPPERAPVTSDGLAAPLADPGKTTGPLDILDEGAPDEAVGEASRRGRRATVRLAMPAYLALGLRNARQRPAMDWLFPWLTLAKQPAPWTSRTRERRTRQWGRRPVDDGGRPSSWQCLST